MVQASVVQGNIKNAHKILDDLRSSGRVIAWLMDAESTQRIYREMGQVY
jgi:hypothetical protein